MLKQAARFGIPLLILLVLATPAVARKKKGPVEYGSWKVRITPAAEAAKRGEKATEDTLVLQQGVFRSDGWALYGFAPVGYTIKDNAFVVEVESGKSGHLRWSGLIHGDAIAGRLDWTMKDGTLLTYTYSGSRAGSETAKKR
jgi:hypothetical protein